MNLSFLQMQMNVKCLETRYARMGNVPISFLGIPATVSLDISTTKSGLSVWVRIYIISLR